jgi:hypothetical protein
VAALAIVLAAGTGFALGWRVHRSQAREGITVEQIVPPTEIAAGTRPMIPVFARGVGDAFEVHLQILVNGNAATGAVPAPEASYEIVVASPDRKRRYVERRGHIDADMTEPARVTTHVAGAQTVPPTPPGVEIVLPVHYKVVGGGPQTLEVEVGPVTGANVTGRTVSVSVYEVRD